jgi:hypothetical protein
VHSLADDRAAMVEKDRHVVSPASTQQMGLTDLGCNDFGALRDIGAQSFGHPLVISVFWRLVGLGARARASEYSLA